MTRPRCPILAALDAIESLPPDLRALPEALTLLRRLVQAKQDENLARLEAVGAPTNRTRSDSPPDRGGPT